jgi:hypothetical protein
VATDAHGEAMRETSVMTKQFSDFGFSSRHALLDALAPGPMAETVVSSAALAAARFELERMADELALSQVEPLVDKVTDLVEQAHGHLALLNDAEPPASAQEALERLDDALAILRRAAEPPAECPKAPAGHTGHWCGNCFVWLESAEPTAPTHTHNPDQMAYIPGCSACELERVADDVVNFGIGFAKYTTDGVTRLAPEDVSFRLPENRG